MERSTRSEVAPDTGQARTPMDGAIDLRDPKGTYVTLAVEAKRSFDPRAVGQLSGGLSSVIRSIAGHIPLLVVAPWISSRTQELLTGEGINYIDLTGNALLKLENPALYIRAVGAAKNPQPASRGQARVRGPKAARLIRLLVDVRPPYGVSEIAAVTGLTAGYISRLLDALDRDALVERAGRGRVEDVDVPGLLRRWAESYDVLKTNDASTFLAPRGANDALSQLAELSDPPSVAVTGSFAAVRLHPSQHRRCSWRTAARSRRSSRRSVCSRPTREPTSPCSERSTPSSGSGERIRAFPTSHPPKPPSTA